MPRSPQRWTATGILLIAAAVITACSGNAGMPKPVDPVGTWGDRSAASEPALKLASDGSLAGTDGCNRLTGSWSAEGETIMFNNVAATEMICEDVDTWLSGLATGTIDGETLTVLDREGTEIGTLERSSSDEPNLEESGDDVTSFFGTWGTEDEGQPYLNVDGAGTVTGSDGCNTLTGSWGAAGDAGIEFTDVAMTLMACERVDQWLSGLASATVAGDTLTIFDADGTEIGTLQRSA